MVPRTGRARRFAGLLMDRLSIAGVQHILAKAGVDMATLMDVDPTA
jgi:hypothetical protein